MLANFGVEQAFLGAILANDMTFDDVAFLHGAHFSDEKHGKIFDNVNLNACRMAAQLSPALARLASLEVNRLRDAARIRALEEYVDTVSSPLWKRVWFVLCGYRFLRVGRWYRKTEALN